MKPSLSYHIDLTGACNLKCPCCPMGRDEEYPRHIMQPDELRMILDKAVDETYPLGVWLYNYTEPFLHPKLPEMVRVVKEFGLPAYISTNFNIRRNIVETLTAEPEALMVSFSGFTQPTYEKTHRGGNIDKVKEHMELASSVPSKTKLRVHWHRYYSNLHEEAAMRRWVDQLKVSGNRKWDIHAYKAVRMPVEKVLERFNGGQRDPLEDNLLQDLDTARDLCLERRHYGCQLQDGTISINATGMIRNCCSIYRSETEMKWLNTCVHEFLAARKESDMCHNCLKSGGHVYAMELYDAPVHSLRIKAEEVYRKIPMRGRWPHLLTAARFLKLAAHP